MFVLPPTARKKLIGRMLLAVALAGVPLLAMWGGVMWVYNFVDRLSTGLATVDISRNRFRAAFGSYSAALPSDRIGRWPT